MPANRQVNECYTVANEEPTMAYASRIFGRTHFCDGEMVLTMDAKFLGMHFASHKLENPNGFRSYGVIAIHVLVEARALSYWKSWEWFWRTWGTILEYFQKTSVGLEGFRWTKILI